MPNPSTVEADMELSNTSNADLTRRKYRKHNTRIIAKLKKKFGGKWAYDCTTNTWTMYVLSPSTLEHTDVRMVVRATNRNAYDADPRVKAELIDDKGNIIDLAA